MGNSKINKNGKWWLSAVILVCCLTPAAFANGGRQPGCNPYQRGGCQQQPPQPVPEGGSTAVYLLAAGLTCFGAMFLRSKAAKPVQS
jgi:hypothetical protein